MRRTNEEVFSINMDENNHIHPHSGNQNSCCGHNCGSSSRGILFNSYNLYAIVLQVLVFEPVSNLFSSVLQSTQRKKFLLISVNEPLKGRYNQLLTCLNDLLKQQMPMNDYTLGKKCLCPLISLYFPTSYFETELKRIQQSFLTDLLTSIKSLLFTLFRLNYPGSFQSLFVPIEVLLYLSSLS